MEAKLYVGNLPYLTTDDDLRTLFAQAGTVPRRRDQRSHTGTSKGLALSDDPGEAKRNQTARQLCTGRALVEMNHRPRVVRQRHRR
jgi:hypothetical protein